MPTHTDKCRGGHSSSNDLAMPAHSGTVFGGYGPLLDMSCQHTPTPSSGGAWSTHRLDLLCQHTPTPSSGGMVHSTAWICYARPMRHHCWGGMVYSTGWTCLANTRRHHCRGEWCTPTSEPSRQFTPGSAGVCVAGLATRRSACSLRSGQTLASQRGGRPRSGGAFCRCTDSGL